MTDDTGQAMIPRAIQRDPTISWRAKLVYLTLSSRANKHLQCWPSLKTIAAESSCGVSSVKAALNELRDLNLVTWKPGPSTGKEGKPPSIYQLGSSMSHEPADTPSKSRPAADTGEYEPRGDLSMSRHAAMNVSNRKVKDVAADAAAEQVPPKESTNGLVGEWLDHCQHRPPRNVIGQISKQIKSMLDEQIPFDAVRRGLAEWQHRGDLHPSVLPSFVHTALNGSNRPTNGHRAGTPGSINWDSAFARLAAKTAGKEEQVTP